MKYKMELTKHKQLLLSTPSGGYSKTSEIDFPFKDSTDCCNIFLFISRIHSRRIRASMSLSQIKFNYEEKSVIWVTKRLTESHLFSVLCSVYIFALSCYSNEEVTTFKRDSIRLFVTGFSDNNCRLRDVVRNILVPASKSL